MGASSAAPFLMGGQLIFLFVCLFHLWSLACACVLLCVLVSKKRTRNKNVLKRGFMWACWVCHAGIQGSCVSSGWAGGSGTHLSVCLLSLRKWLVVQRVCKEG